MREEPVPVLHLALPSQANARPARGTAGSLGGKAIPPCASHTQGANVPGPHVDTVTVTPPSPAFPDALGGRAAPPWPRTTE